MSSHSARPGASSRSPAGCGGRGRPIHPVQHRGRGGHGGARRGGRGGGRTRGRGRDGRGRRGGPSRCWDGRGGREPGRRAQGGDDPGAQQPVERRAGKAGRGHEREPLVRRDRAHEVDVRRGRPVEHGVGDRAEADAATVGLQRQGRDQPGGQAEGFGGGGGGVRDVVAERAGERQRPGHGPLPTVSLLDGGVDRVEHACAPHHPPPPRADRDDPVLLRPSHDVPVDLDLGERGQGEQQVRRGGPGVGEQRDAVDAVAQRQPDLGREPGGRRVRRRARPGAGQAARRGGPARRPGRGGPRPPRPSAPRRTPPPPTCSPPGARRTRRAPPRTRPRTGRPRPRRPAWPTRAATRAPPRPPRSAGRRCSRPAARPSPTTRPAAVPRAAAASAAFWASSTNHVSA